MGFRKAFATSMVAATVVVAAAGCSSPASGGTQGAVLRMGDTGSTISTLNPFDAENVFELMTFRYVYPYLVQYSVQQRLEGDFATSWQVSSDGRTYTFSLHKGATWSDGKPLTSDDVVWTLDTILKFQSGPTARLASNVAGISSVSAPAPDQVVITYAQPQASALSELARLPILPRHVWEQYASGDGKALDTFTNDAPVVSGGSFVLTEEHKDSDAIFARNEHFYGPAPKLAGFGVQFFGSSDALLQALKAGQLDGAFDVPATAVDALKGDAGLQVAVSPGTDEDTLVFNSASGKTSNRELLDPSVRRAFALAIDRKNLVDTITLGLGTPGTSLIPQTYPFWSDPSASVPGPDVAAANKLLDGLGFSRGADGTRVAGGHPMEYKVLLPAGLTGHQRVADLLRDDLAAIGVRLDISLLDNDAFGSAITHPTAATPDYDLALDDWGFVYDPGFGLSLLTCTQIGNYNESAYCDKGYDAMYAQQNALTDDTARQAVVRKMQEKLAADLPWIPLFVSPTITATSTRVHDLPSSPLIVDYMSRHQFDDVSKG